MRPSRPSLALLAVLAVGVAGCSEKESGLGKGKKEEPTRQAAPASGGAASKGGASAQQAAARPQPKITVPEWLAPTKLKVEDLEKGSGPIARPGSQLSVNYAGVSYSTGKVFDSSFKRGQPFPFQLGAGMVIPGWDQGIQGMKVGGRRRLTIPPKLAYGPQGQPPTIKPNETLVFVIDLLSAR
ncbi:MAG: FKBP-type peptidyl-prolyl cis-trans isomerase [Thermoleophilaceae bacterium]